MAVVIALIDYGAGNLRSVHKALTYLRAEVRLASDPGALEDARAVVLPGVGAFDDCLNALQRQRLLAACREFIASGRPFLGICVGYQALFESSDEFQSSAAGMRVLRGSVVRFPPAPGLKIPQIGWNQVQLPRPDCPLFRGIPDRTYFYFVHSYFPRPLDRSVVAGWTEYGETFASAVWSGNVYATQFHPEKSQGAGLQVLRNFLALTETRSEAAPSRVPGG
jgi:imidazole glycerol-phosphate synthase subunit HisH